MKQYGIEFEDDKAGTNIGLSLSISCREKKKVLLSARFPGLKQ
jgi:hypothetical protein